jgi:hypothetical protein
MSDQPESEIPRSRAANEVLPEPKCNVLPSKVSEAADLVRDFSDEYFLNCTWLII